MVMPHEIEKAVLTLMQALEEMKSLSDFSGPATRAILSERKFQLQVTKELLFDNFPS